MSDLIMVGSGTRHREVGVADIPSKRDTRNVGRVGEAVDHFEKNRLKTVFLCSPFAQNCFQKDSRFLSQGTAMDAAHSVECEIQA